MSLTQVWLWTLPTFTSVTTAPTGRATLVVPCEAPAAAIGKTEFATKVPLIGEPGVITALQGTLMSAQLSTGASLSSIFTKPQQELPVSGSVTFTP